MAEKDLRHIPDDRNNRLRILREGEGLTQKELSDILGVPQQTISDWETGAKLIPRQKEFMICDYFLCDSEYLFYRSSERRIPGLIEVSFQNFTEDQHKLFQRLISVFAELTGVRNKQ